MNTWSRVAGRRPPQFPDDVGDLRGVLDIATGQLERGDLRSRSSLKYRLAADVGAVELAVVTWGGVGESLRVGSGRVRVRVARVDRRVRS